MTWNDVSKLTALCASQACPVREGCLRYQGWLALPQEKTQWLFVSPSQASQAGAEGCPMFAPRPFAWRWASRRRCAACRPGT